MSQNTPPSSSRTVSATGPAKNHSLEKGEYELIVKIGKGEVSGGGLKNVVHVNVEVDGELVFSTEDRESPPVWNQEFKLFLDDLEPPTPTTILFSAYKKRWTSPGYKLVGTVLLTSSSLSQLLNKGRVEQTVHLMQDRRNLTLHGSLQLSFEVRDQAYSSSKRLSVTPSSSVKVIANNQSTPVKTESASGLSQFFRKLLQELVDDIKDWITYFDKIHQSWAIVLVLIVLIMLTFVWLCCNEWHMLDVQSEAIDGKLTAFQTKFQKLLEAHQDLKTSKSVSTCVSSS